MQPAGFGGSSPAPAPGGDDSPFLFISYARADRERVAKARVLGAFQPLEDRHLRRDDLGAVPLEAANRRLLALFAARADRVAHQKNAPSGRDQPKSGFVEQYLS